MSNVSLDCNNFFDRYYIQPLSDDLSKIDRAIACVATTLLFVLTAGLFHLIHYHLHDLRERNIQPQPCNREDLCKPLAELGIDINARGYHSKQTPLESAVARKDFAFALELIDLGVKKPSSTFNVNGTDGNGKTLLHHAKTAQQAKRLLELGANPSIRDSEGKTPYQCGSIVIKQEILRRFARIHEIFDSDIVRPLRHFPFNWALYHNRPDLCKPLVELGFNINARGYHSKRTPLEYAVARKNVAFALELIDLGADTRLSPTFNVNVTDRAGKTLLHHAKTAQQAKKLLELGANPSIRDSEGKTPYQCGSTEIKQEILRHFARIHRFFDGSGFTQGPFIWALENDRRDLLKPLAELGVDINPSDRFSQTLLEKAFLKKDFAVVLELIDLGADGKILSSTFDVNVTDGAGKTLLHYAKTAKQAQNLLELGIDPTVKVGSDTLYQVLPSEIRKSIIKYYARIHRISSDLFKDNPIYWVAENNKVDHLDRLVRLGVSINDPHNGNRPLEVAFRKGHINCAMELMRVGADIQDFSHTEIDEATIFTRDRTIWIKAILSLPEKTRRGIYNKHSDCVNISRFMFALAASLPEFELRTRMQDIYWDSSSLPWILDTWEMMGDLDFLYAKLASLEHSFFQKALVHCPRQETRRLLLEKKRAELDSLFNEEKEKELRDKLDRLSSCIRFDSSPEDLKKFKQELVPRQRELDQIMALLHPWNPEKPTDFELEEIETFICFVSKATYIKETFSKEIVAMLKQIEDYLPKKSVLPSIADDEEKDVFAILYDWNCKFSKPRKIKHELKCSAEDLSERGISEGKDFHLLGLTNELRYLIEEAEDAKTKSLDKIQEWGKKEDAKLRAILDVVISPTDKDAKAKAEKFFQLLAVTTPEKPEEISQYFQDLKDLDLWFKIYCLRTYLAQPEIEKYFENEQEESSLSTKFSHVDNPAKLYQLRSIED